MQARVLPTSHEETVAYLLETEASEMEYEVARCKPLLTPEFMQHLERCISTLVLVVRVGSRRPLQQPSVLAPTLMKSVLQNCPSCSSMWRRPWRRWTQ